MVFLIGIVINICSVILSVINQLYLIFKIVIFEREDILELFFGMIFSSFFYSVI